MCKRSSSRNRRVGGFTLLELTVTLLIVSIGMAGISMSYSSYNAATSAKRAAQVFAQDLSVSRSYAVRSRDTVKVVFSETTPSYRIESLSGDTLVERSFTASSDIKLDTVDLQVSGDSIYFDARGRIDFSGIAGSIGEARFIMGAAGYQVRFNMLGTSRVSPL